MPAPQRDDVFSVIDELKRRVDRLEQGAKSQDRIALHNVPSTPAAPADGGIVYVESGVLKYKAFTDTTTPIANP